MSDHYVTLVIKNSTEQTMDADGEKAVQFLREKEIAGRATNEELSFKPGAKFQSVMAYPEARILELISNEIKILKGRQIFSEMEGAEFQLICNQCNKSFDGFQSPVIEVIDSFHQGVNEVFRCTDCGFEENLRTANTKGFAAGFLGIEFNNWGPLEDKFINDLGQILNSPITVIEGHI